MKSQMAFSGAQLLGGAELMGAVCGFGPLR